MAAANARAKKASGSDQGCPETPGDDTIYTKERYEEALEKIKCLETELAFEKEKNTNLGSRLTAAEDQALKFSQELVYERDRYKQLYKEIRVERRARQHSQKKKGVFAGTNKSFTLSCCGELKEPERIDSKCWWCHSVFIGLGEAKLEIEE